MAVTDYVFSAGADNYAAKPYLNSNRRGISGIDVWTRLGEVRDGLGNTFLMGEAAGGNDANPLVAQGFAGNRVCVPLATFAEGKYYDNIAFMAYGRKRNWGTDYVLGGLLAKTTDRLGAFYAMNDCAYPSATDHFAAPTADSGMTLPNFRSVHPGGGNFLFGDGSVRFVKETIDRDTYLALSTALGGEVVSADKY
jgi:prepilin-type processing-associated H-X9-DG protein